MTDSNTNNDLSDVVESLEKSLVTLRGYQEEIEEWKTRALRIESLNEELTEKVQKSEHNAMLWKNRATRAGEEQSTQPSDDDERNPTESPILGATRPSSRLAPIALLSSQNRLNMFNDLNISKSDDDFLFELDGGDSCTFLVSDQEDSVFRNHLY